MTLVRFAAAAAARRLPASCSRAVLASSARRSLASAAGGTHRSFSGAPLVTASVAALAAAAMASADSSPSSSVAQCHCQVPCGIFDDPLRLSLLREHCATIRKSSSQIRSLASHASPSGEQFESQSFHQASRWIAVKEDAASQIIETMGTYFLCQRVKRANFGTAKEYWTALELHHRLMQSAMRCKQTVDPAACDDLERAIADVAKLYEK